MRQEELLFEDIRTQLSNTWPEVMPGKMMSSPAITYTGKVFAFLSRKHRMVYKLGKDFEPDAQEFDIHPFSPFVKKGPLPGWFEVPYSNSSHWRSLAEEALALMKG